MCSARRERAPYRLPARQGQARGASIGAKQQPRASRPHAAVGPRSKEFSMPALDPRQKAERISAVFRAKKPIDILPAELIPGDLDEAYQVRAHYEAIEAAGRGAVAGYKIGLTTPVMQQLCGVGEPCYGAIFANEVHRGRGDLAIGNYCR